MSRRIFENFEIFEKLPNGLENFDYPSDEIGIALRSAQESSSRPSNVY